MGNLLTSLLNSTGALSVYDRAFSVIQNNISNANTPGYVDQNQSLLAAPFEPNEGIGGGVMAGPVMSARSEYIEQDVRNQQSLLGNAQERATDLGQVQTLFDISGNSGVPAGLNTFFNTFSQLSVNPNDDSQRQAVLSAAQAVAQDFNRNASGIGQATANIDSQTPGVIADINQLTQQIASLNQQYNQNIQTSQDAGLDAQMHAALENLSTLVNVSVLKTSTGGFNVYLGGQTPLVVGQHQYSLAANFGSPQTVIQDPQGNDVTSQITGGRLSAMLELKNSTLPGYLAQLNTLAQDFADQVNQQLSQGLDKNGNPPAMDLFTYNAAGGAAASLAVTGITADQIAAASAGAPGGNGNALAVANLANTGLVNGMNFTQFYGGLGGQVGRDVSQANADQSQAQDLVTQAQQIRQQRTGVSLDAEAAKLLQFQQAYQAVAKVVTILNDLTQTLINMIPQS